MHFWAEDHCGTLSLEIEITDGAADNPSWWYWAPSRNKNTWAHLFKNKLSMCKQLSEFISHDHFPASHWPFHSLQRGDYCACLRQWMVQIKPITTCEFIPMLQRCKPPTGWPKRLGMDLMCSINGDSDNAPFQQLPTLVDRTLHAFRSFWTPHWVETEDRV